MIDDGATSGLDIIPQLLTQNQAGKRIGVSERTIYTYVKAGALRAMKLDRRVMIDPRDLAAFVESHKVGGVP